MSLLFQDDDFYDEESLNVQDDALSDDDNEVIYNENISITNEDLVEGGDFHLKSALQSHEDMLGNYVYQKEYTAFIQPKFLSPVPTSFIDIMSRLEMWARDNVADYFDDGLVHFIRQHSLFSLETVDFPSLITAEMSTVFNRMSSGECEGILCRGWTLFSRRFSWLLLIVQCILVLMPIISNIKNMRNQKDSSINGAYANFCKLTSIGTLDITIGRGLWVESGSDQIIFRFLDDVFWMPIPWALNVFDKMQERMNCLLYTSIMSNIGLPHVPSIGKIEEVLIWGDDVLRHLGNAGYGILGDFEAVCVGHILKRDDPDLCITDDPNDFLNSIVEGVKPSDIVWYLRLDMILSPLSVEEIADVRGLYRIWGHPIIDIDGSIKKHLSVTQKIKTPSDFLSQRMTVRTFKSIFVRTFFSKHHFYPKYLTAATSRDNYVVDCLKTGVKILVNHPSYDAILWDDIELCKNFSIPSTWNILHLAKDKAISPDRDEIYGLLCKTGSIFNAYLRRGVLKLLSTNIIPLREFLHDVGRYGLALKDCIIGMCPKERELKIMVRFFALMSFKMRLYFTATESLLSDKILPYFRQITMSLNLLDMQKKMSSMSRLTKDQKKMITYVVNMDFIKWNGQMRYDVCSPVFKELDKLFGCEGLYDQTHKIFKKSVIYLANGARKLSPDSHTGVYIDGKYAWMDEGAGKDGLRQKGWTIMTVCDIEAIAARHSGVIELVGGGDNQVLTVTYSTGDLNTEGYITHAGKEKIKNKMKLFIDDLTAHFEKRGLPLKTSETWVSTTLFMYNKHMYHEGRALRSPLKQVSRAFPFSNNTTLTLSSMSQCIGTALKSIVQKETLPHGALLLKYFWACQLRDLCMYFHPLLASFHQKWEGSKTTICRSRRKRQMSVKSCDGDGLLLKILYLPNILGGPGMSNLPAMLMRGFTDPLTESLYFLISMNRILRSRGHVLQGKFSAMCGFSRSSGCNYEPLVEDPTSVNHDAPRNSNSEQREATKKILKNSYLNGNKDFSDILTLIDSDKERNFYNGLCSGSVLDIRVLREIAGASLFAITNTLLSRIDKTATLNRLTKKVSILRLLAEAEISYISYLFVRDEMSHDIHLEGCSRVLADKIRCFSWGKKILSVTVPTPLEYLSYKIVGEHLCDNDAINIRTSNAPGSDICSVLGPCEPYLGSFTKEKFKSTEVAAAYGDEELIRKAISLTKIINWRYPADTAMGHLLMLPLRASSNLDPIQFIQEGRIFKGDYEHRRRSNNRVHGGIPNFIVTPTTHVSIVTSTWLSHNKGGKNENIHFQACIIWSSYREAMRKLMNNIDEPQTVHAHVCCRSCIQHLEQPDQSLTSPSEPVMFPTLPLNSFVFVDSTQVEFDFAHQEKIDLEVRLGLHDLMLEDRSGHAESYCGMSWMLIMDILGYARISKSFFILQGVLYQSEAVIGYMINIWKCLRHLGVLSQEPSLNWGGFSAFFRSESGMHAISSSLGIDLQGDLEGGITCKTGDMCDAFDAATVQGATPMVCNLSLGMIQIQVACCWIITITEIINCPNCMINLRRLVSTRFPPRAQEDPRCSLHYTGVVTPNFINCHPENLSPGKHLKAIEESEEVIPMTENLLDDIVIVESTEGCWSDIRKMSVSEKMRAKIDLIRRAKLILSLIVAYDIYDLCIPSVVEYVRVAGMIKMMIKSMGREIRYHILINHLSQNEGDTIYDSEHACATLNASINYSVRPAVDRLIFADGYVLMDLCEIKKGDVVVADTDWFLQYGDSLSIYSMYHLRHTEDNMICGCVIGDNVFQPGSLSNSLNDSRTRDRSKKKQDCMYISLMESSPGGGSGWGGLRKRCSWALMSTTLDVITVSKKLMDRVRRYKEHTLKKSWTRIFREDMMIFVISLSMRSIGFSLDNLLKIAYLSYNSSKQVIKIHRRTKMTNMVYLDVYTFLETYYRRKPATFFVEYLTIRDSISLLAPLGNVVSDDCDHSSCDSEDDAKEGEVNEADVDYDDIGDGI